MDDVQQIVIYLIYLIQIAIYLITICPPCGRTNVQEGQMPGQAGISSSRDIVQPRMNITDHTARILCRKTGWRPWYTYSSVVCVRFTHVMGIMPGIIQTQLV